METSTIGEEVATTDQESREEALEAVDLHCTVGLPCMVLNVRVSM